eukprot:193197-Pelagomonas_calceolata.AAC.6
MRLFMLGFKKVKPHRQPVHSILLAALADNWVTLHLRYQNLDLKFHQVDVEAWILISKRYLTMDCFTHGSCIVVMLRAEIFPSCMQQTLWSIGDRLKHPQALEMASTVAPAAASRRSGAHLLRSSHKN